MTRRDIIRLIYLYLFSLVGLILLVIGSVRLVDIGLKAYVFKNAERAFFYPEPPRPIVVEKPETGEAAKTSPEEEDRFKKEQQEYQKKELQSRREREASNSIAMLLVGLPLFVYHWRTIQKEREQ